MSDQDQPRIPSPDEIELFKKYRDFALPAGRLASLDDFAKWLFTSITVIGSLAAAFSSSAIKSFDSAGLICFFVAILLTGVSLFLAVQLRAVEPGKMNPYNLEDMLNKYWEALAAKQRLARRSGTIFALAVLVAGAAPLASLLHVASSSQSVSYAFGKDGVKASAVFSAPVNTTSALRMVAVEPAKESVIATQRGIVGQDGVIRLEATGAVPPASTTLRIELTCDVSVQKKQVLSIPLQPSPDSRVVSEAVTEGTCSK